MMTELKRISRHDALVALGRRTAELQRIADETGQILPLLADVDCGLSRADVNVLVQGKYVLRKQNMLGASVALLPKAYEYLAAHRRDPLDADLAEQYARLEARITELRAENKPVRQVNWISGQLGRATAAEIRLLEHEKDRVRAQRRLRAGGE